MHELGWRVCRGRIVQRIFIASRALSLSLSLSLCCDLPAPSSCPYFYLFVLFFLVVIVWRGRWIFSRMIVSFRLCRHHSPFSFILLCLALASLLSCRPATKAGQFVIGNKKKDSSPTQSTVDNLDHSLAPKLISADHEHTMNLSATPSCLLLAPSCPTLSICLYTLQNKVLNHYCTVCVRVQHYYHTR